jgi:signal transduction histidine kinase/phage shock protein PspC (stress-responsive transcriptional regulator)
VSVTDPARSSRPLQTAWIGGVCAGLADQLGWSVLLLRLVFVVLGAFALVGVLLYLVLWLVMPEQSDGPSAPGLESHSRTGMRSVADPNLSAVDVGMAVALGLVGFGLLWLVEASGWGLNTDALLAGVLGSVGLGLIWWQADRVSFEPAPEASGWRRAAAAVLAHWTSVLAVLVGIIALIGAVTVIVTRTEGVTEMGQLLLAIGVGALALLLAVSPWLLRARRNLARARQLAILADARADMAAHLHDSVLQTLALIQRQAADPKKVSALARRQERELRQWLYGEEPASGSLVEALTEEMLDVETDHEVDVELVSVGDTEITAELDAVVRAAGEAMVNAAKHSGSDRIDLYCEVDADVISVYIRDRGVGFDLAGITEDRMGVRGSIIERMKRTGGRAIIKTAPGEGTEIRLELPR